MKFNFLFVRFILILFILMFLGVNPIYAQKSASRDEEPSRSTTGKPDTSEVRSNTGVNRDGLSNRLNDFVSGQQGDGLPTDIRSELSGEAGFNDDIGVYITSAINFVILIGALATLIFLVWGGIEWITSGGDAQKYAAARSKITAAIVGLAILTTAFVVWELLLYFFGVDVLFNIEKNTVSQSSRDGSRYVQTTDGENSGGGNGNTSSNNDCWPFSSCAAWQTQYVQEHPGSTPPPIGDGNAWDEFQWSVDECARNERQCTQEDWERYYNSTQN